MNKTENSKIDYASISEFIESNIQNRTRIAFLFDDKKTGKKDIKIYLGEILKTAKLEGYNQGQIDKEKEIMFKLEAQKKNYVNIENQARHDLLLEVGKVIDDKEEEYCNLGKCYCTWINKLWLKTKLRELGKLKDE